MHSGEGIFWRLRRNFLMVSSILQADAHATLYGERSRSVEHLVAIGHDARRGYSLVHTLHSMRKRPYDGSMARTGNGGAYGPGHLFTFTC